MANSKHVVFWADPKDYADLAKIAKREDRSIGSLLRRALRDYLRVAR